MSFLPIQRALVMEEDESTRLLITESLKNFGIPHVEDYADEALALKRLLRGGFDLAILDLGIWSSPVAAASPTLVIATSRTSAARDPEVTARAQRLGADTLVEKPFTAWLLLRRLEVLLDTPAAKRMKIVELHLDRFQLCMVREQRLI